MLPTTRILYEDIEAAAKLGGLRTIAKWTSNSQIILIGNIMKLKIDSDLRLEKFIPNLLEEGVVYFIENPNGGLSVWPSNDSFNAETNEPLDVIPFWSNQYKAYARAYAQGSELKEMMMYEFQDFLVHVMKEQLMIGINWDAQGYGSEIEPAKLYQQIQDEVLSQANQRADHFISDFLTQGIAYYLFDDDLGIVTWPSADSINPETQEPFPVTPLWTSNYIEKGRAFANGKELREMPLNEFRLQFLPFATKNAMLIGLNWDQRGYGKEVEPQVLLATLEQE